MLSEKFIRPGAYLQQYFFSRGQKKITFRLSEIGGLSASRSIKNKTTLSLKSQNGGVAVV